MGKAGRSRYRAGAVGLVVGVIALAGGQALAGFQVLQKTGVITSPLDGQHYPLHWPMAEVSQHSITVDYGGGDATWWQWRAKNRNNGVPAEGASTSQVHYYPMQERLTPGCGGQLNNAGQFTATADSWFMQETDPDFYKILDLPPAHFSVGGKGAAEEPPS